MQPGLFVPGVRQDAERGLESGVAEVLQTSCAASQIHQVLGVQADIRPEWRADPIDDAGQATLHRVSIHHVACPFWTNRWTTASRSPIVFSRKTSRGSNAMWYFAWIRDSTRSMSCESTGTSAPSTLSGPSAVAERSTYEPMISARSARVGSFMA